MITEDIALQMTLRDGISRGLAGIKDKLIGIGMAYLTWNTAEDVIGGIIKATDEAEKVQVSLEAAVKRHGITWKTWADQVEFASMASVRLTGMSDELWKQGLQKLINANIPMQDSLRAMAGAMDFAKESGLGLESAALAIARSVIGARSELTRYKIEVADIVPASQRLDSILTQINQKFGGAAQAAMNTFDGQLKRLKETFNNLGEALGKGVKITQILAASFAWLSTWMENIPKLIKDTINDWKAWFDFVISMPKAIIETWSAMGTAIHDILARPWDAIDIAKAAFERIKTAGISVKDAFVNVGTTLNTHVTDVLSASTLASLEFEKVWENFGNAIQEKTDAKIIPSIGKLSQAWKDFQYFVSYGFRDRPDVEKSLDDLSNQMTVPMEKADAAMDRIRMGRERKTTQASTRELKEWRDKNRLLSQSALETFGIAIPGALAGGVQKMLGQWKWLNEETNGIFKKMAQDFLRLFIDEVLGMIAKKLVTGILKLFAVFGAPSADQFVQVDSFGLKLGATGGNVTQEGANAGKRFTAGALRELSGIGAKITAAMGGAPSLASYAQAPVPAYAQTPVEIHIHGAMTPQFIRDALAPYLERDSRKGYNAIQTKDAFSTGNIAFARR